MFSSPSPLQPCSSILDTVTSMTPGSIRLSFNEFERSSQRWDRMVWQRNHERTAVTRSAYIHSVSISYPYAFPCYTSVVPHLILRQNILRVNVFTVFDAVSAPCL